MAKVNELKQECNRLGCYFEHDNECQCYRAMAPNKMRFDIDLHELIAVYGDGFIGNGETKSAARADLLYRLRGYESLESE